MHTQLLSQTGQMIELCCEYLSVWCILLYVQCYCTFVPPFCYWWLIMKKHDWKLYHSPNPDPSRVRRKCNSTMFLPCGFTLKHECDMVRTYSQMHHTDKYSQHSLIIRPFWLNGWLSVYELSGAVSSSPVAVT